MTGLVVGAPGNDGSTAIRQVNESLQGPVVDILGRFVPELRQLPANKAYERTLDDIGLLQRCFAAFRAQRDSFAAVLVDAQSQPVSDDSALLSCGRTLNQVVAMIVRTAAKRYFRRTLAPPGAPLPRRDKPAAAQGLVQRLTSSLSGRTPSPPRPVVKPARSRADQLYDAIKDHLLHDWQVPLVPSYADMSPSLARALGAKLLELRTPEDVRRVVADPAEAAKLFDIPADETATTDPAAASAGRRDERVRLMEVLTPDGRRLRVEALSAALLRPDVRGQLGSGPVGLRLTDSLRGVGGMPVKVLVAELGLSAEQLAVFLLVAHETMGEEVFGRIFGQPGESALVMRITQKARLSGIGQRSDLAQCATFVRGLFGGFRRGS